MEGLFFGKSVMAAAVLALAVDALLGDPKWVWGKIPHPVVWIGTLAAAIERRLNGGGRRIARGALGWILVVGLVTAVGAVLQVALLQLSWGSGWGSSWGWIPMGLIGGVVLAAKSLDQHVRAVAVGLDRGLDQGRAAVSHIVGRDTDAMDAAAVSRAAIESLAENASDGVVAPLLWFLTLGLPGLLAYKAINTLDSMWGYRNGRFEAFGKVAARIDDGANWLPARLTAFYVSLATGTFFPFAAALRDGPRHRSPNAGYPEAAFATALRLSLAGPRPYDGIMSKDAPMGTGTRQATAGHIRAALKLFWYTWGAVFLTCGLILALGVLT